MPFPSNPKKSQPGFLDWQFNVLKRDKKVTEKK